MPLGFSQQSETFLTYPVGGIKWLAGFKMHAMDILQEPHPLEIDLRKRVAGEDGV